MNTKVVYLQTVTYFGTNPAKHRVTSLMRPMTLPRD